MPRTPKKTTSATIARRSPRLKQVEAHTNTNTIKSQPTKSKPPNNRSKKRSQQKAKPSIDTERENNNNDDSSESDEDESSKSEGESQSEETDNDEDQQSEADDTTDDSEAEQEDDDDDTEQSNEDDGHNDSEMEHDDDESETSENEWVDDDNAISPNDADHAAKKGEVRWADKTTYKDAAQRNQHRPTTEIEFQQRRLAIMVSIPEVDNNVDRLSHLVKEVNEFLKFARKNNSKFRLRPFDTNKVPKSSDKNQWRTRMIDNDSADFRQYCQGYFPFTPPRGGIYRLRINAVMDKKVKLPSLIENVTHDWAHKDGRSLSDLKSQMIYDPIKIGYFMRATRYVTHSYELVEAMEWQAKQDGHPEVKFGISWGTIPSPVGGYDKDTAVQAVILETNKDTQVKAVDLLKSWYPLNPKKKAKPPYPGNFRFVINKDHPSVRGNNIAIANLSVLMERQGIFNMDTRAEQTYSIKALDMSLPDSNLSLRHRLLQIKSKNSGKTWLDKPIFMSVSKSINSRTGQKSTWFTFHKAVTAEATSIVKNLPLFIKAEWQVDPEECCFAQFLNDRDEWDTKNRVANNEDTDEIAMATKEYTMDLHREAEQVGKQQDDLSLSSKAAREMQRMMGDGNETIASISKERQRKTTTQGNQQDGHTAPTAIDIDATKSIGTMSGISATSTKTSKVRAKLHREFANKFEAQNMQIAKLLEEKKAQESQTQAFQQQMSEMTAMLQSLYAQLPQRQNMAQDESSQNSGEPTTPNNNSNQSLTPHSNRSKTHREDNSNDNQSMQSANSIHSEDRSQHSPLPQINPDFHSDEDFQNDELDYLNFKDQQDQKEEAARLKGEKYIREEWYGSQPADIPLPTSFEDEQFPPIAAKDKKRLIITDSDDIDPNELEEYFKSNRSSRDKKRQNAPGSRDPGEDE